MSPLRRHGTRHGNPEEVVTKVQNAKKQLRSPRSDRSPEESRDDGSLLAGKPTIIFINSPVEPAQGSQITVAGHALDTAIRSMAVPSRPAFAKWGMLVGRSIELHKARHCF